MPTDSGRDSGGSNQAGFGRFFALSPDLLCLVGLDGCIKQLNPAWEKALGYAPAQLKASPLVDLIHPDDREQMRRQLHDMAAQSEAVAFSNRILCRDGSVKWLSWTAQAVGEEGVYAIARDITERMKREDSLRQALAQRRELLARLYVVREQERTQLARVVHDEMGQALTGLKMDLAWLQNHLDPDATDLLAKTQAMSRLIDSTIQAARQISIELRPPILDDLGLVAALEWQLRDMQKRTGLHCELIASEEEVKLDVDGRTTVFRIFQEILTNVSRHAHASILKVFVEETDQHLILRVHDNGRGISQDEIHSAQSIGLLGMRERARLRGGEVQIEGAPDQGTTVTVRLPLDYEPSKSRADDPAGDGLP